MRATSLDESALIAHFRTAVTEDLRELASLHDREVTKEVMEELKRVDFPYNLGLQLQTHAGQEACSLLKQAITEWPETIDEALLDELASDFSSIYLNNAYRASPYESVWLTDEGLTRQAPMIQVREWYKKYEVLAKNWKKRPDDYISLEVEFIGHLMSVDDQLATLKETARFLDQVREWYKKYEVLAKNWKKRPDDYISLEVEFIGHLMSVDDQLATLKETARFLDEHPLRWFKEFAARVSARCATAFYAGLVIFTVQYLEELRDLLAKILDDPRPSAEEVERKMKALNRPVGMICTPAQELMDEEEEKKRRLQKQLELSDAKAS